MKNAKQNILIIVLVCAVYVLADSAKIPYQTIRDKPAGTLELIRGDQMESADVPDKERVVHFPKDRSLGKLYIQKINESDEFGLWFHWTRIGEEGEYFCPARGDVRIPAGKRLILVISPAALSDLSGLKKLGPDDLYGIVFDMSPRYPVRATDKSLSYLTHLTGLRSLDIRATNITDNSMKYVANLKSLESLEVPNRVTSRGMIYIGKLTSLKRLYFSYLDGGSRVSNDGLRYLANLKNLQELALAGDQMGDTGLAYLKNLPQLYYLFIRGRRFGDKGMVHVREIPSLRMLVFHEGFAHITDAGMVHISQTPRLETLCLNGMNNITDDGLALLTKMHSLKKLEIGSSQVTDKGLLYLSRIATLERLDLPQQQKGITDVGVSSLAKLPNLKELHINRTHKSNPAMNTEYYTDKSLEALAECKTLEVLGIGSIGITDAGLGHVAKLTNLKKLTLYGCDNVTDKGLAELTTLKSLRDLNITYGQITLTGINHLNSVTNLTRLDVSIRERDYDFRPDGVVLDLSTLTCLEKLRMNFIAASDKFADEDLRCLAGLKNLKWLHISPHDYTDKGMTYLSSLSNMERLVIGGNGLTDEGLKDLADMENLNLLSITSNNLSNEGLRYLGELKSLRLLDISSGTDFSDAALYRLQNELPELTRLRINGGILSMENTSRR
ncbi:MAG: hypothetical protein JW715_15870 [Sedimentisphaerales bacterium]|nr:hypothetical protein [Sedimentisphaerales bacterium]